MNYFYDIVYNSEEAKSTQAQEIIQQANNTIVEKISISQKKKKQKQSKSYHWTKIQHSKYINYLFEHKDLFTLPQREKKRLKIHIKMSRCLRNRTSSQCRTHHQKYLEKYHSIDNIILNSLSFLTPQNLEKIKTQNTLDETEPLIKDEGNNEQLYQIYTEMGHNSYKVDELEQLSIFLNQIQQKFLSNSIECDI